VLYMSNMHHLINACWDITVRQRGRSSINKTGRAK